jgi:integrase
MARSARNTKLETRSARLKLTKGVRYWQPIGKGLALGYRRTKEGYGTWCARLMLSPNKYALRALEAADDQQDADGVTVLDYFQAQAKARKVADDAKALGGVLIKPTTVKEAAERYLEWYRENRKGVAMAESAVRTHILPGFGDTKLADLTTTGIKAWLGKLATSPARLRTGKFAKKINRRAAPKTSQDKKARQSTANRILTVLKAILNKAHADGYITANSIWAKVKPFENVDQARIRYLTDAEAQRLVNACPPDLRSLVRAALLTGARRGELAALTVADVNLKTAQIYIAESKSGKPRYVPLNPEGLAHFKKAVTGKTGDELVFTRKDGTAWKHNFHVRALKAACEVAKVAPMVSFHELRHTYASHLANAGIDLLTISKLLGHSDTRITAKHYAHLADKTLANAVTHLPSFEGKRQDAIQAVA